MTPRFRSAGAGLLALVAAATGGYLALKGRAPESTPRIVRRPGRGTAAATAQPHFSRRRELLILAVPLLATALLTLGVVFGLLNATRADRQAWQELERATPTSEAPIHPRIVG
jgi:hypothetical protein